jgi:hypothetical protein
MKVSPISFGGGLAYAEDVDPKGRACVEAWLAVDGALRREGQKREDGSGTLEGRRRRGVDG